MCVCDVRIEVGDFRGFVFPSRFGGRWSLLGGWKPCAGMYSVGRGWRGDEGISVGSLHGAEDAAATVEKGKRRKMR
ncbi:unnamed protein product [Sphagnum troendelagicum]|uniref:Uncharacterized protein n=1 Tax=Sphagnum jensenii TaxID=128206 RepID=A0ABP0VM14_9BRYO